MRIEFAPNEAVIIAEPFKTNGHAGVRYTMMTQRAIRHFTDFEGLLKALREYYKVPKVSE